MERWSGQEIEKVQRGSDTAHRSRTIGHASFRKRTCLHAESKISDREVYGPESTTTGSTLRMLRRQYLTSPRAVCGPRIRLLRLSDVESGSDRNRSSALLRERDVRTMITRFVPSKRVRH